MGTSFFKGILPGKFVLRPDLSYLGNSHPSFKFSALYPTLNVLKIEKGIWKHKLFNDANCTHLKRGTT